MEYNLKSPLSPDSKTEFLRKIKSNKLILQYKKLGIDISYILKERKSISVFKCLETGYKFYYPFDIAGDSIFYEHFQKSDWYYMPWKWEHEIAKDYIEDGQNILEVGCAHGAFLKKINKLFNLNEVVGLELNETAEIQNSKWRIINKFIQDFQIDNKNKFDLVCSFEVLEHIAEVNSFLEAKVNCLKVGGKLIIAVPNNETFVGKSDSPLNFPPHHMGLWDTSSLKSLSKLFPLKLVNIHYEELQSYHVDEYMNSEFYSKYPYILGVILRKVDRITGKYQKNKRNIENQRSSLKGHTILAVFEKV